MFILFVQRSKKFLAKKIFKINLQFLLIFFVKNTLGLGDSWGSKSSHNLNSSENSIRELGGNLLQVNYIRIFFLVQRVINLSTYFLFYILIVN